MFESVVGEHVGLGDIYLVRLAFNKNGYELNNVSEMRNDMMNIWYTAWADSTSNFVRVKLLAKLQQAFTIVAIEPVDVEINERYCNLSRLQRQFDDSVVSKIMKSNGKINRDYKGYKNDDFEFNVEHAHGIAKYKLFNKVLIKKDHESKTFNADEWDKAFQFIIG